MSVNASFFLSSTKDKCVYNGASIDASNLSENGNLCAYVEGVHRVWACSAPDRVCWTWGQSCKGSDGTPSDSQIYCSSNSDEWCCTDQEECTRTEDQYNICWGLWRNPVFNMTSDEATTYNREHYSTLASTTSSTATTGTSVAASTTAASATNVAQASASAAASSSAAAASASATGGGSASLSTGAVAGVAVGCVVGGIALAGVAGLFIWRRRKTSGGGGRSDAPRWAADAPVGDAKQPGAEPLSRQELQSDNQVYEAEGRPVFERPGETVAKVGSNGVHELPAELGERHA